MSAVSGFPSFVEVDGPRHASCETVSPSNLGRPQTETQNDELELRMKFWAEQFIILPPLTSAFKSLSGLNLRRFRTLTLRGSTRIIGRQMSAELRELIDSVRAQLQADLDARLGALADRHEQASAEARGMLLTGIREIDAAQSVSDTLTAIVRAAAREAPRAALFVGTGDTLEQWVVEIGRASCRERVCSTV